MQSKVGEYDKQKAERRLSEFQKGLTMSPETIGKKKNALGVLGLSDSQNSGLNKHLHAGMMESTRQIMGKNLLQKPAEKQKKPLIYMKSSDAKAMEIQRALKKHEMTLMKGVPAMAPSQMSRG